MNLMENGIHEQIYDLNSELKEIKGTQVNDHKKISVKPQTYLKVNHK